MEKRHLKASLCAGSQETKIYFGGGDLLTTIREPAYVTLKGVKAVHIMT